MLSHMTTESIQPHDLAGVFAVPPLPRRADAKRRIDFDAAEGVARHIQDGGITRYLYGGNAFLYHITLDEYETLLGWLDTFGEPRWPVPSVGPSFGRAIDQAKLLRRYAFRTVMVLPCNDPRDARGMEAGLREIADACGVPLILYLKSEDGFGADKDAGLDAIGRLMHDGIAIAIKYAVVLEQPRHDTYLDGLLRRVDRQRVMSGMGERPAIVHMRDFGLAGFTTGSGCIAARTCSSLFEACVAKDWARAEGLRAQFMPLEDLRDAWGPARVLHHATELAGIAHTGSIPPYVSSLDDRRLQELAPVARGLRECDSVVMRVQPR
jgi:dihydrodipicolinate synthase/N-acetylneuraminate lyase